MAEDDKKLKIPQFHKAPHPEPRKRTPRPSAPGTDEAAVHGRDLQVGDPGLKKDEVHIADSLPPMFHNARPQRLSFPKVESMEGLPKKQLVRIKLFQSFHEGSGFADETPMDRLDPTKGSSHFNRVHGSIDARWPGQLQVGQRVSKIAATNHDLNPVFAIEWTNTNGIHPAIFYIVGKTVQMIEFGDVAEINTNMDSKATNNATGGMFDDNGSGVPYLYACFGAAQKIVRMNRAQAFDDTMVGSDVKAGLLLSLNGDAYRTIVPTSGTATCQVSKCPRSANRMDLTAWGDGVTIGFAGTSINALTAVRQAPVAIKPEGVFAFNAGLQRWINYTPSWRTFMHFDNGKGAYHLGDALVIPMGDGSTMIFDGNHVRPFDPGGPLATPNRHTTRDDFVNGTMMSMRHWVLGVTSHFSKIISAGDTLEMRFEDDSGGPSYSGTSASIRDLDLDTDEEFTLAETADSLLIGWKRPFASVQLSFGGTPSGGTTVNNNAATMTVKVGTTAGEPGTYTTVGVKNTGFRDFTELAGAPFGQSGSIVLMVDPVELGWVKTTIDSVEAYWMRISFSAALDQVNLLHARIAPWYPSIDSTNFPLDGLDRSGNFPHVQYGRMGQNGAPWWHDMVSLSEPDHISQALFANVGGVNTNHPRRILLIGRFGVWAIEVADNDRPGYEAEPYLNDKGLIESTSFIPVPGAVVRLNKIIINGHEFGADVKTFFYYGWEWGHPMSRMTGAMITVPSIIDNFERSDRGTRFRWSWGFTTSSVSVAKPTIPTVTSIEAEFEVVGTEVDMTPERPMQTVPRN